MGRLLKQSRRDRRKRSWYRRYITVRRFYLRWRWRVRYFAWRHCGWRDKRLTVQRFFDRLKAVQKESWVAILMRDPCVYCGRRENPSIEHVHPGWKRRGEGKRNADRVVCACKSCNHQRGSTPLLQYLLWRRQRELQALTAADERRRRMAAKARERRAMLRPIATVFELAVHKEREKAGLS